MSYTHHDSSMQKRINTLEQQNKILGQSIIQLNLCYQQKILILQNKIVAYENKCQQVLEQQKKFMDQSIEQIAKYQSQLSKMNNIISQLQSTFLKEKQQLQSQYKKKLEQKQQQIEKVQRQKQEDRQKVQQLAEKYLLQISILESQLKQLKEETSQIKQEEFQQDETKECDKAYVVLKDISNIQPINQEMIKKKNQQVLLIAQAYQV